MPKNFYSRKSGAVTGAAAAIISTATVITALTAVCAAKITEPQNPAVFIDNGEKSEFFTRAANIDEYILEQRSKLHPFDVITYAGCGANGEFEIAVERAPYVKVLVDGEEKDIRALRGESVEWTLSRAGITLGEYDSVSPGDDEIITGDCTIAVTCAFPVYISADGETREVYAAGITVGELIARERIKVNEDDELSVSPETVVSEGMKIAVNRVEYREREKTQTIPYDTEYKDSTQLKIGDTAVETEGVDGLVSITIRDKYVNGAKVNSEMVDMRMTDPVNEVIAQGTALNTPYSKRGEGRYKLENGIPTEYAFMLNGKVTAYAAPVGAGTYSGRPLVVGSCGVDPDVIPFGSEVYIVSEDGSHVYGYAVASDTGDIKGSGVICDAFMGNHYEDCLWWHAQYCNIYVLTVGDNSVSWR